MRDRIGFIGLGDIGKPMALNLAEDGFDLSVYDIRQPACDELAARGAQVSAGPVEMAGSCDIICVCVRDDLDVKDVVASPEGILAAAAPGTIVLIHSTIRGDTLRELAGEATRCGVHLLDAAVSGGAIGAMERKLCYMVGGPARILERCRPVLEASAARIIHAGNVGAGLALKLCNNLMTYASFVAIHESARLVAACGLSLELLKEVGSVNGVVTPMMTNFIEGRNMVRASGDEKALREIFTGFAAIAVKDMDAGLELAREAGVDLPGARCTRGLVEAAFFDEYQGVEHG